MGSGLKASKMIVFSAAGALSAALLAACGQNLAADCVASQPLPNGSYQIVDDRHCGNRSADYVWYYGGSNSGGHVSGGSTVKPKNANITSRSGQVISRGGFGGRGGSSGSG
ncbi:hypothetical protein SAMN05421505_112135 [Sinosporangium album]|uniref:Lipoprotein n=1 Tax=Sinosporangium album TaxID=504805 RepID=A0A1G8AFP9_9ACTN|nr:hypothetical protein [Sinosporangium album]SDH19676.1 hypothetical protein SAMN05421505_112135 [Sinosporangium album]